MTASSLKAKPDGAGVGRLLSFGLGSEAEAETELGASLGTSEIEAVPHAAKSKATANAIVAERTYAGVAITILG
jgi:hypothetical protein